MTCADVHMARAERFIVAIRWRLMRHSPTHRQCLRYRHRNYVLIRPWINQDCHLHRSTLLLNLNCTDNVQNINFNATPKTQAETFWFDKEMTSSLAESKQIFGIVLIWQFLNSCSLLWPFVICKWVLWCKKQLVSCLSQKVQNLCLSPLSRYTTAQ